MSEVTNEVMLQVGEAARVLKMNPITLSRWIKAGKVQGVIKAGGPRGNYRIPLSVVERLYQEQGNDN